jgi:hypothetical protein
MLKYISLEKSTANITVEWLTLLLHIWEVLDSISAQKLAILTEVFHGFPQFL